MVFQPGKSGNPKGRPRKGDSLAEAIRQRLNPNRRKAIIDAIYEKAKKGDVSAFDVLAKRGWPDEAKGELSLNIPDEAFLPVRVEHVYERPSS